MPSESIDGPVRATRRGARGSEGHRAGIPARRALARRSGSLLGRGAVLAALLGLAACTDVTGATQQLLLVPSASTLTLAQAAQDGLRAMLHNRSGVTITLQGGGCDSHGATVYHRLPGIGWIAQPSPGPVTTLLASIALCPYYLVPPDLVHAGDSVIIHGTTFVNVRGDYRLEIATTAGLAISSVITVR